MDIKLRKLNKQRLSNEKRKSKKLPDYLITVFTDRGISYRDLKAFEYTDMDGAMQYADGLVAFDDKRLYVVTGKEHFIKKPFGKSFIKYEVTDFSEYLLEDIDSLEVERFIASARLMGIKKSFFDGEKKEYKEFAYFSLGTAGKIDRLVRNYKASKDGEELSAEETKDRFCPKCGSRYPNSDRPICPKCMDKRSLTLRLLGFLKYYYKQVAIFFAFLLLSSVFAVLSPYIGTKMLYDDVLTDSGFTLFGKSIYGEITLVLLMIIGVRVIALLLTISQNWVSAKIAPYMIYDLKLKIFSAMQRLSLSFYTSKQTGFLMERVTRDAQNVYWFFMDSLPYVLINVTKFAAILVIMITMDWKLTVAIVAVMPLLLISWRFIRKLSHRLYHSWWTQQARMTSLVSDTMNGQRVIKAFGKEDEEAERFGAYSARTSGSRMRAEIFSGTTGPLLGLLPIISHMFVLAVGGVMIVNGNEGMTFGELMTFATYMDMLYAPLDFFSGMIHMYARCMDSTQRIFEVIDSEPEVSESDDPIPLEKMKGDIEVKDVMFEYEPGRPVIKNLSLSVKAGHMVGIVGRTGAGKSTIVNLIARLYDVKEGQITIDGVDVKRIPFKDMKNNIGIVSQEIYLFSGSIADNIRYARPEASMEEVVAAAKAASAHDFIMKLPDGYETRVGSGGQDLSGGEKQRISIARTVIQNPGILILDEATAAMDTETERRIQESIHSLQEGRTTIAIAHRLSTLRDADVLAVIDHGEMKEYGTHEELMKLEGVYHKLYTLQQEAIKHIAIAE